MIQVSELERLLPILKANSVHSIKYQGLELRFHVEHLNPPALSVSTPAEAQGSLQEVPIDEATLPPDLRADTLMDQDKILNWSVPQAADDKDQLPLTGDMPLE